MSRQFTTAEVESILGALGDQPGVSWASVIAAVPIHFPESLESKSLTLEFISGQKSPVPLPTNRASVSLVKPSGWELRELKFGGVPLSVDSLSRHVDYEGPTQWQRIDGIARLELLSTLRPDMRPLFERGAPLASIYSTQVRTAAELTAKLGKAYRLEDANETATGGSIYVERFLWLSLVLLGILLLASWMGAVLWILHVASEQSRTMRILSYFTSSQGASLRFVGLFSGFVAVCSGLASLGIRPFLDGIWDLSLGPMGLIKSTSLSSKPDLALTLTYAISIVCTSALLGLRLDLAAPRLWILRIVSCFCGSLFVFVCNSTILALFLQSSYVRSWKGHPLDQISTIQIAANESDGEMIKPDWRGIDEGGPLRKGMVSRLPGGESQISETVVSPLGHTAQMTSLSVTRRAFEYLSGGALKGRWPSDEDPPNTALLTRSASERILATSKESGDTIRIRKEKLQVTGVVEAFGLGPQALDPQIIRPLETSPEAVRTLLTLEKKRASEWSRQLEPLGFRVVRISNLQEAFRRWREPLIAISTLGGVAFALSILNLSTVWLAISSAEVRRQEKQIAIRLALGASITQSVSATTTRFAWQVALIAMVGVAFCSAAMDQLPAVSNRLEATKFGAILVTVAIYATISGTVLAKPILSYVRDASWLQRIRLIE